MKAVKICLTIIFTLVLIHTLHSQLVWNYAASLDGTNDSYIAVGDQNASGKFMNKYVFTQFAALYVERQITAECWVYPDNATQPQKQIIMQKAAGNNTTGFCFYLNQGRPSVKINNVQVLSTITAIPSQKWSHIAFTFSNQTYSIYINGVLYNQTSSSLYPKLNTDSLYIGKGSESPFKGYVDEVRLWGRALTTTELSRNFRSTLATYAGFNPNYSVPNDLAPDGVYSKLVLSLTFQDDEQAGPIFSMSDWSGCGFNANAIGITPLDLRKSPSNTIFQNESLDFMASGYAASPDNVYNSPTTAMTIEFWVYASSLNGYTNILRKGTNDYAFKFGVAFELLALVNNNVIHSGYSFFTNDCMDKWTHVGFTYSQGNYKFFINGNEVKTGVQNLGNVNNSTDSLYFGEYFWGYIDEVRIANYVKPLDEVRKHIYESFDKSNVPNQGLGMTNLCYSFDGYAVDNMGQGGTRVFFRNNARFSAPATQSNVPVSPVNRCDSRGFHYDWKMSEFLKMNIPANGFGGEISSSIQVSTPNVIINDLNVYVALNHQNDQDLKLYLISPQHDTIILYNGENQLGTNDNLITIFDDEADSSLFVNKLTSFGPIVKPESKLNAVLGGKKAEGTWTLLVKDIGNAADIGVLYNWGLQINNSMVDNKTGNENNGLVSPSKFSLGQNYPNPFNPSTKISFTIPNSGHVKMTVFDMLGKEVAVLVNNELTEGEHEVVFKADGLSSGIYFYKLESGSFSDIKKMILVK